MVKNENSNFSFSLLFIVASLVFGMIICIYYLNTINNKNKMVLNSLNEIKKEINDKCVEKINLETKEKNISYFKTFNNAYGDRWYNPSTIKCTKENLNTYTSPQYGFSFEYPNDWLLFEDVDNMTPKVKIKTSGKVFCSDTKDPDEGYAVDISIIKNIDKKSLQDIKQEKEKFGYYGLKTLNIKNADVLYFEGSPEPCGYFPGYIFVTEKYIYLLWSFNFPTKNTFEDMLIEIVNSFTII